MKISNAKFDTSPTEFLTQEVTEPLYGNSPVTFVDFVGVNIVEDDNDFIFQFSASVLADFEALMADPDLCNMNSSDVEQDATKKARDTDVSSGISERQQQLTFSLDGNTWTIGPDTECRARWTIEGIFPGNNGGFGQLIPINNQSRALQDFLDGGVVSDMTNRIIAFSQSKGYLAGVC